MGSGWLVRRANGDAGASHQRGGAAHAGEPSAATTAHQPPARRRSTRGRAEHGHHRAPQDRAPPTDEAAQQPEHTWISAARPSSTSSTDALVRGWPQGWRGRRPHALRRRRCSDLPAASAAPNCSAAPAPPAQQSTTTLVRRPTFCRFLRKHRWWWPATPLDAPSSPRAAHRAHSLQLGAVDTYGGVLDFIPSILRWAMRYYNSNMPRLVAINRSVHKEPVLIFSNDQISQVHRLMSFFFPLLSVQFYPTLDTSKKSFHDPKAFSFSNATTLNTDTCIFFYFLLPLLPNAKPIE